MSIGPMPSGGISRWTSECNSCKDVIFGARSWGCCADVERLTVSPPAGGEMVSCGPEAFIPGEEPINEMTRIAAPYFRCALDDPHISYPSRRGVCGCTIKLQSAPVHKRCCCLCSSFTGVTSCVVTCTSCLHCISLSTCVHLCVFDETETGWQL